jgi:5-methylcytosine-specific restriction endonuclease McrA
MTAKTHGRSGRPWRTLREQVLAEQPYCEIRGPKCRGVATTVDHIVPLSVDPLLAHVRSNLRSSCTSCNYAGGARMTNAKRGGRPVPRSSCAWYEAGGQLCSRACEVFPLPHGCERVTARLL